MFKDREEKKRIVKSKGEMCKKRRLQEEAEVEGKEEMQKAENFLKRRKSKLRKEGRRREKKRKKKNGSLSSLLPLTALLTLLLSPAFPSKQPNVSVRSSGRHQPETFMQRDPEDALVLILPVQGQLLVERLRGRVPDTERGVVADRDECFGEKGGDA